MISQYLLPLSLLSICLFSSGCGGVGNVSGGSGDLEQRLMSSGTCIRSRLLQIYYIGDAQGDMTRKGDWTGNIEGDILVIYPGKERYVLPNERIRIAEDGDVFFTDGSASVPSIRNPYNRGDWLARAKTLDTGRYRVWYEGEASPAAGSMEQNWAGVITGKMRIAELDNPKSFFEADDAVAAFAADGSYTIQKREKGGSGDMQSPAPPPQGSDRTGD